MMRDAFGDALQKIASAAHTPSAPAEVSSATEKTEIASLPEPPHQIEPPAIRIIEEPRTVDTTPPETVKRVVAEATVSPSADVTSEASSETTDVTIQQPRAVDDSRSPLSFVLDHRRQTAAVVVLICIAAIWSDEGTSRTLFTSSNGQPSQSDSSDVTDTDSMLSEFDAIQVQPLREPADPVEPSQPDPFPFSIPPDEAEASVQSEPPAANVSQATNQAPSATSPAAGNDSGPQLSPFSPVSSSASHSVRFTGQIEPLK